ncbi:hypothetical protein CASFOL_040051 [Castilleja foliolosa]|uniref:Uncharacterized protein n=1 Tax=Castilleja foliolosa TaxID=1961234 RepID=A0ABD3BEQ4_9LAMI
MDMEKLMQKHPNVSRGELEKIRETSNFLNRMRRQMEEYLLKQDPVLSVHVLPSDKLIDQHKPLTTYGRIYAEYRDTSSEKTIVNDLFSRSSDDAQILGPSGGPLTLFGPDYPCRRPFKRCRRFNITRLVVDVFIGEGNNLFAEKQLCFASEDMTIDLESVKLEYVHGELGSLAVRYIAVHMLLLYP